MYKTAVVAKHVYTHNGENDLCKGTIVGVKYRFDAVNKLYNRTEAVFTVTLQGGKIWGDVYASVLDDFVL